MFFIRKTLTNAKGYTPIFLRITVNGAFAEMRIQRNVNIDNWNKERAEAKKRDKVSREINDHITSLRVKIYELHRKLESEGVKFNAKTIRDILQGKCKSTNERTIKQIFEEHNNQIRKLSLAEYSPATVNKYEKSLEILLDYIKYQYNEEDMELDRIDPQFIDNFMVYIRANLKVGHNTAVKRLKHLKKVIRIALMNNWIKLDPFRFTKLQEKSVEKEFLVKEEIERIISKEITIKRLEQVRDVYLFCLFTGLAFTDVSSLRDEHIVKDNNGEMWIRKARLKTQTMCNIPLLDIPLALIEKYRDDEYCKAKGTLLPLISNQKSNFYLKEIADVCGINKRLTMHTARHSFATLSLSNGISIESVSKMLGHTNIRMTQHYARVLDSKINDEMNNLRGKFVGSF